MTDKKFYCSFCGESEDDVVAIVRGPDVNICDACIGKCVETLTGAGYWPTANNAALLRGVLAVAAYVGPGCTSAVEAAMGKTNSSSEAAPGDILADAIRLETERDALKSLLEKFVNGENDLGENLAERHMYFTEAQTLIAKIDGEIEDHTVVPDAALADMQQEITILREALNSIRDTSSDLRTCEIAADALVDSKKGVRP